MEARHKEQRLRERVRGGAGRGAGGPPGAPGEATPARDVIKEAEEEYLRQVAEVGERRERGKLVDPFVLTLIYFS